MTVWDDPTARRMARLISLVLALQIASTDLPAQGRPAPFETLDLGLTALADVNHSALHRWWSPGPALGVGVSSPFYLGTLELGLQYAHPTALRNDVPGFRSLLLYAGWGGEHALGRGFAAGGGLRVGIMAMRFDGDTLPDFRAQESEMGVAARAVLRWIPAGTWYADSARGTLLGSRTGTSFPGNDYGVVRYTGTVTHPSAVHTYPGQVAINGAGNAYVGQAVCRSGATTGVRCGAVSCRCVRRRRTRWTRSIW